MAEMRYDEGNNKNIKQLIESFHPKIKSFNRHEIILQSTDDINTIGVLISGAAYLATINLDFQKRIIEYYEVNDIFCNRMISVLESSSYHIYASAKCSVAFLDHRDFLENTNDMMVKLQNQLIADYGKRSLAHIDILSQRSLRNKLLSFFDYCRKKKASERFALPISFSELADYLAVDRSAMMREIGKLKEEKIILSEGRNIILLK